jgi:prevent-host-death family protein
MAGETPGKVISFKDPNAEAYRDDERLLSASEARQNFSAVLGKVRHGFQRILVKDHKEPVAGIVPIGQVKAIDILEKLGVLNGVESLSYRTATLDQLLEVLRRGKEETGNAGNVEGDFPRQRGEGDSS